MYATILLCVDNKGKEKMDWDAAGILGNIKPPLSGGSVAWYVGNSSMHEGCVPCVS